MDYETKNCKIRIYDYKDIKMPRSHRLDKKKVDLKNRLGLLLMTHVSSYESYQQSAIDYYKAIVK